MALNKLDTHVLTMLDLERELLTEEISDYTLMEMYNLMLERSPEEIEEMLNVIEENVKIEEEELEEAMNKMKQSNKRFKSVL
jgi:2-hydroxy-3-keto-5-methylthiopentenyl-1-phosphate phosphatase